MKKSQIISFIISLFGLLLSAFILYRKKASRLTYVIAIAAAIILFFAINYVLGLTTGDSEARKVVDQGGAEIVAGSGGASQDTGIRTEPIDESEAQLLGHPSLSAQSTIARRDNSELITPVVRLSR